MYSNKGGRRGGRGKGGKKGKGTRTYSSMPRDHILDSDRIALAKLDAVLVALGDPLRTRRDGVLNAFRGRETAVGKRGNGDERKENAFGHTEGGRRRGECLSA